MQSSLMLLLLLAAALEAKVIDTDVLNNVSSVIPRSSRLVATTTFSAQTEMTGLEFIAFIADASGYLGSGVVVNKFWVVTLSSVVSGKTATDLTVTAGAYDPLFAGGDGETRGAKEIKEHAAACGASLVDCISLVRVCPSFPDTQFAVPLDSDITVYRDPALQVNMYLFKDAADTAIGTKPLNKVAKNVGELCECKDNALYLMDNHVCIAEDPANHAETGDETKGLIVTNADNTKVIGFLVKEQDTAGGFGEIVLGLGQYQASVIDVDGVVADFEYP